VNITPVEKLGAALMQPQTRDGASERELETRKEQIE
jgi:hypothetical protein